MARNEERWREERERRRWARGDWSGGEGPAAAPSSPYGDERRNPGFYSPGQAGYGDYRAGHGFGGDVGFARREGGYAGAGGYGYEDETRHAPSRGAGADYSTESNYTGRGSGAYPTVESAFRGGGYDHWDLYHGRKPVRGALRGSGYRRDFLDRAGDEVASWLGDDEAEYRRRMDAERQGHRGRGPRSYTRSDDRIREDVSDRLTDDPWLDASEIEVTVSSGEVTLNGTVSNRYDRRRAEDCAEGVSGVRYVQNNLRARPAEGVDADIARRNV
jgi:osmotically-inducible protein OsmY